MQIMEKDATFCNKMLHSWTQGFGTRASRYQLTLDKRQEVYYECNATY